MSAYDYYETTSYAPHHSHRDRWDDPYAADITANDRVIMRSSHSNSPHRRSGSFSHHSGSDFSSSRTEETYVRDTDVVPHHSHRRRRSDASTVRTEYVDREEEDTRVRERSSSHSRLHEINWAEVAVSAIVSGGVEAFRSRHDDNGRTRALTAAATAGVADAFLAKKNDGKSVRHVAESVVAGLVVDRVAHGGHHHNGSNGSSHHGPF